MLHTTDKRSLVKPHSRQLIINETAAQSTNRRFAMLPVSLNLHSCITSLNYELQITNYLAIANRYILHVFKLIFRKFLENLLTLTRSPYQ